MKLLEESPVTGFTLELDGEHEAIQRILSAAFAEMNRIEEELRQDLDRTQVHIGLLETVPLSFIRPIDRPYRGMVTTRRAV